MPTEPSRDPNFRLHVYIRITGGSAVVEVVFPKAEFLLAQRYRESISNTKEPVPALEKPYVVAFKLPGSVIKLETSGSLEALLLHFDTRNDATNFKDAICLPVNKHPYQVYIKQYWGQAEVAGLEESLPSLATVVVERSTKPPERAGTAPGRARSSSRTRTNLSAKNHRVRQ